MALSYEMPSRSHTYGCLFGLAQESLVIEFLLGHLMGL
jgi:hypothetical protein